MDTLESLRMERRRCKIGSCPWYRSISQAKGQGIQITTMGQNPLYANVLLFGELINISSYFIAWKFRGDIPCCRTAGNLKKRLEAMVMKEEDN